MGDRRDLWEPGAVPQALPRHCPGMKVPEPGWECCRDREQKDLSGQQEIPQSKPRGALPTLSYK